MARADQDRNMAELRSKRPQVFAQLVQVDAEIQPLQHQPVGAQGSVGIGVELATVEHGRARSLDRRWRIYRDEVVPSGGETHVVASVRGDNPAERTVQELPGIGIEDGHHQWYRR